jgi:hypothetical protein
MKTFLLVMIVLCLLVLYRWPRQAYISDLTAGRIMVADSDGQLRYTDGEGIVKVCYDGWWLVYSAKEHRHLDCIPPGYEPYFDDKVVKELIVKDVPPYWEQDGLVKRDIPKPRAEPRTNVTQSIAKPEPDVWVDVNDWTYSGDTRSRIIPNRTFCQPHWIYEPKEDITAYELARILLLIDRYRGGWSPADIEEDINDLGEGARHFTKRECPK